MIGFSKVGILENRSGERLRTATARKNDKNRFRRRLRTRFFASGRVFCRFWAPGRDPKIAKKRSRSQSTLDFFAAGNRFFAFSSLERVPGGSRSDSGGSGGPPGSDFFQEFYDTFLLVFAILFCGLRADFVGVCRVCDAFLQVACRSCQGMSGWTSCRSLASISVGFLVTISINQRNPKGSCIYSAFCCIFTFDSYN